MHNSFISSKPEMFQESYHSTSSRYERSLQLCGAKNPATLSWPGQAPSTGSSFLPPLLEHSACKAPGVTVS